MPQILLALAVGVALAFFSRKDRDKLQGEYDEIQRKLESDNAMSAEDRQRLTDERDTLKREIESLRAGIEAAEAEAEQKPVRKKRTKPSETPEPSTIETPEPESVSA